MLIFKGQHRYPIVQSVAFAYPDVDMWLNVAQGKEHGHIYSRNTNPTVFAFEEKVRQLEGAEAATSSLRDGGHQQHAFSRFLNRVTGLYLSKTRMAGLTRFFCISSHVIM